MSPSLSEKRHFNESPDGQSVISPRPGTDAQNDRPTDRSLANGRKFFLAIAAFWTLVICNCTFFTNETVCKFSIFNKRQTSLFDDNL